MLNLPFALPGYKIPQILMRPETILAIKFLFINFINQFLVAQVTQFKMVQTNLFGLPTIATSYFLHKAPVFGTLDPRSTHISE